MKEGTPAFLEAPLEPNEELAPGVDPMTAGVILVSAPGAVGKSTLARQVAFQTGAIYVDLALADPVGGNAMTGGLAKSGLYPAWQDGSVAVLIDGLDEARIRVTQEAFEAFLEDVLQLAGERSLPVVLFGRTGAVQDAWLVFADRGMEPAIVEIGYYSHEDSIDFSEARLANVKSAEVTVTEREALELILDKLRSQTESDGDRFAGYAPVLQAVADRVAAATNPAVLVAQIRGGEQPVTLTTVADAILERERKKLDSLEFQDASVRQKLYTKDEQLDRLAARIYGLSAPNFPTMNAADAKIYSEALSTWVVEHPFMRTSTGASSVVFDAMIATHALQAESSEAASVRRELAKGAAANPFLAEFYIPDNSVLRILPSGHVGIIYASLRARLSLGDSASLSIDGPEEGDNDGTMNADVEINVVRKDSLGPRVMHFETDQSEPLVLGSYLEDVSVFAPGASVEIGAGVEAVLVAPVSIQCQSLVLNAEKIVVDPSASSTQRQAVHFEASEAPLTRVAAVPTVRGDVKLSVIWPGSREYPWTGYSTIPAEGLDPRVEEGLRRFRRFVIAFRSHSKGSLARFKDKIEHSRMTKESGQLVLDHMVRMGIVTLDGPMYHLDPDKLGSVAGATYADCVARTFSEKTLEFIDSAVTFSTQ